MFRTSYLHMRAVAAMSALALLAGCTNFGPRAVQAGRADYNAVLHDTTDQQLLTNLVRLRYRDRPYFLEVSSVTTQFSFSPQLSATGALGSRDVEQDTLLNAGVTYSETPTISYTPLQGDDFARRLLTPVSLEALVLLSQSGWSVERLLRVCVQRIDGVPNAVSASGPTPAREPEYRPFLQLARWMRELQLSDDLTIGYRPGESTVPSFTFSERALSGAAYRGIVEMLQLTPGKARYDIVPSPRSVSPDTIGIQTRSLNGILHYLSHAVEVPAAHRERGLVTTTRDSAGLPFDWGELAGGLFRVATGSESPGAAAVKIRHRGQWFYVADNDLDSKSTFSLLAQLFALQAGSGEGLRPVLTIPVGR